MTKPFLFAACSIALLSGCASEPKPSGERPGVVVPSPGNGGDVGRTTGSDDQVLAEIGGVKLTESQLKPVLYKAYGLDVLLKVIQLNMAKADAAKMGITVSPADVVNERNMTLDLAFGKEAKPEDYPELLKQLLAQQRVSEAEFDVVMEVNAYLRAMVKPIAMQEITEAAIREKFNSEYGQRVEVRTIAVNNLQDVADVQRRLNDKNNPITFEALARQVSKVASAQDGGLLPPFSRAAPGFSPVFIEAAFALEPGQVSSDPVQDKGYYHVIKLEQKFEPRAVKYEDVKESVRDSLIRQRQSGLMAAKRTEMAQRALRDLQINEPAMKADFAARLAAANPKPVEKSQLMKELDAIKKDVDAATRPATKPSPTPAAPTPAAPSQTAPAPAPVSQPK